MTDIVERLRARAMRLDWATVPTHELEQAADEIERLREALEKIGEQTELDDQPIGALDRFIASIHETARDALSQKEGE